MLHAAYSADARARVHMPGTETVGMRRQRVTRLAPDMRVRLVPS